MKTLADKLIFEANFTNSNLFAKNGGSLFNSTLEGGKLRTTSAIKYRAYYPKPVNMDSFFTNGGTLAFDLDILTVPPSFYALTYFAKDSDYNLTITASPISGDVNLYCEVKNGSSTDYYRGIGLNTKLGKHRLVLTWDKKNTTTKVYIDSVLIQATSVASGPTLGSYPASTDVDIGGFNASRNSLDSLIDNYAIYGDVWTKEDVAKDYSGATFHETDSHDALVWSDLNDKYLKGDSTELLMDGDMEAAGTSNWLSSRATLSKEGSAYEGAQCLRVTATGAGSSIAYQFIAVIGVEYRIRGRARSNGSATMFAAIGTNAWGGTNSTAWQEIDVTVVATSTSLSLGTIYSSGYVEFDDISVVVASLNKTTNKGTASNGIIGDGVGGNEPTLLENKGMHFASVEFIEFKDIEMDNSKDWTIFYGLDADNIDTAVTHYNILFGTYQSNGFLINQLGGTLYFYLNSAAPTWFTLSTFFQKGLHSVCLSSKGGIVTAYRDGVAIGFSDLSAKAAFNGKYTLRIGNDTASLEGDVYMPIFKDKALSARQVRELHEKFLKQINS